MVLSAYLEEGLKSRHIQIPVPAITIIARIFHFPIILQIHILLEGNISTSTITNNNQRHDPYNINHNNNSCADANQITPTRD